MGIVVRFHRGAWWIFIRRNNRRRSMRVGSKSVALQIKKDLEERFAREGFDLPAQANRATFKAYAHAWLDEATKTRKGSTVRFYRDNLENHIYPVLGEHPIHRVTRADVKFLLSALSAKSLKPKTVTGVVRTLSTILSEAVEDGHLAANPALRPGRLTRMMRDPNAPKRPQIDPYTREEAEILVETARRWFPEWHPFLLCALRTGLRLGELRALEWGSIDWRQRFVRVERNFVEGELTTPKSGHHRDVDMSLQLRAVLRLWRRQQRRAWFERGMSLPDLVFPSDYRTPLDDSRIRKALRAIVRKTEIRQRKSVVHVLRHTFGSLLIQQGESLAYVKEQMGHASIAVTVDVYGHLLPGGNKSAVDRLDDASGGIPAASESVDVLVSQTFASWNHLVSLLRKLEALRRAA